MSSQSHRHRRPSLEEGSPEPVQLMDTTQGLDEFAPEPEQSLLRVEKPGAPAPRVDALPSGRQMDARPVRPSPVDWTRRASRSALVSSVVVVAAVSGILLLRSPATPLPEVDSTELLVDSAAPLTTADPPPVSPMAVWTTPSESPSVKAVPSGVIPPPAPPPQRFVAIDAPKEEPATPAANTAAVAESSPFGTGVTVAPSVAISPASSPTPSVSPIVAEPRTTEALAAETTRPAAADVPVDAAAARLAVRDLDARAIENVLGQYRDAFNRLDAGAAVAVWPAVNEKTLARAFERLDDQEVSFDSCNIEVGGVHAEAACSGTARYVPRVGSRTPRTEARLWRFLLRRTSDGWIIDRIDAR